MGLSAQKNWKYTPGADWPHWLKALVVCAILAAGTLLFLSNEIALSFREEPKRLLQSAAFQKALSEKFRAVVSINPKPNTGGRPPKTRQWKVNGEGGFFTFRVEGFSTTLPFEGTFSEDFRVSFKIDSTGNLVVTNVESAPWL